MRQPDLPVGTYAKRPAGSMAISIATFGTSAPPTHDGSKALATLKIDSLGLESTTRARPARTTSCWRAPSAGSRQRRHGAVGDLTSTIRCAAFVTNEDTPTVDLHGPRAPFDRYRGPPARNGSNLNVGDHQPFRIHGDERVVPGNDDVIRQAAGRQRSDPKAMSRSARADCLQPGRACRHEEQSAVPDGDTFHRRRGVKRGGESRRGISIPCSSCMTRVILTQGLELVARGRAGALS